ncbi:TerB family tellurite resistance protein [Zoogloea sp.]|uniref:tellurite resistance TerB family protein n=1 Tax=Zoogloea sp. TaxID=49181 RepID=UPI0035B109D2
MRAYPTNSPEALARLIAMAILADGRLDNREIDWLKHHDTAALVGVDRDVLVQALLDCCRDVITEAEQERVFLLEDRRLARLADDITDPAKRKVALSAMLIIAKADGTVSEGEQTLLRFLMKRWALSLEDLAA